MSAERGPSIGRRVLDQVLVVAGACVLTLACFLLLPLIQAITQPPFSDTVVRAMDTTTLPPPPPVVEEEIEEEPEPEEPPPELEEEMELMDLSQLELALNPGGGDGLFGGATLDVDLGAMITQGTSTDELFSASDLDQKPRVVYQAAPSMTAQMRKAAPATVRLIFIVDPEGRVQSPLVRSSTDPLFEKSALAAIKQWRFEPGKREGQPVSFRMMCPITFPEG